MDNGIYRIRRFRIKRVSHGLFFELVIISLLLVIPVAYLYINILEEVDYKKYGIMFLIWVVVVFVVIGALYWNVQDFLFYFGTTALLLSISLMGKKKKEKEKREDTTQST